MADIFISYSKTDRDEALKLSAFLEAEGWTVWWDKSLRAADFYRDEILKELTNAGTVIAIWTENSIRSDWVRAEAARAKADAKLIPVKVGGISYGDLPLPFGEMHTEDITDLRLIRAAVISQLARPATSRSELWLSTKIFRLQLLSWMGALGGAVTLFTNLAGVLKLADWARFLVTHWHAWSQYLWSLLFSWIASTFLKKSRRRRLSFCSQ